MKMTKVQEKWLALEISIPRKHNEMFPKKVRIVCKGSNSSNRYGYSYISQFYVNCDTGERKDLPKALHIACYNNGVVDNWGLFNHIKHIFPDIYSRSIFKTRCYDYTTQMTKELRKKKLIKLWQESE
jgi:hypothetical protein